ncbi:unnamed protein product [Bursaphelenchus xylophilus]|uniref:(pine wood nematode) hypothetical protein n=1 Tax=Bursaphelenchus xylophilus TaxID=6326 RepID=A0A1I7RUS3_BURXY|nr:unnamed protein product [Bursaphelenchus xylophilus]CAG9105516.1 unnamed protein product [Bursaphelenchus xylophilus]
MLRSISHIQASFWNGIPMCGLIHTTKRFASNRHVVVPNYPLHKKPGKTVSIEVAQPSDFGIFEKYCKTLYHAEPLTIAFECPPEDIYKHFMLPLIETSLRFPYSIMVMDGDQMVGFSLTTVEVFDEHRPLAPLNVDDFGPIVEHYAKLHGVTEKKMKNALGIACYASDVVPNFMPKMERYVLGHGALASVAKEYTGNGLASAIIIENARQMAADRICNYFYGNPTANETGSVAPKLGMPEVWRLNFTDIKIDGKFAIKKSNVKAGLGAIAGNFGLVQDIAKYEYLKME